MNEESWNVLGKQKLSDVTGRLRNAPRRLTKFRGVFTASFGNVSWHGNTGAIPCKVWCEYLLGMDWVDVCLCDVSKAFGYSKASYGCWEGSCGSE